MNVAVLIITCLIFIVICYSCYWQGQREGFTQGYRFGVHSRFKSFFDEDKEEK